MHRGQAIILGIVSVIPAASLPFLRAMPRPSYPLDVASFPVVAMFAYAIVAASLMMWYLGRARMLKPGASRNLWCIAILLGNVVVFPVFWYLHIWRDTTSQAVRSNNA